MTEQIPYWSPPRIEVLTKPKHEIPISGIVGANTQLTILSDIIAIPFKIIGARFYFPDNAIHNVRAYLLYATERNTSTVETPTGTNVFSRYSPTAYFIGHSEVICALCNIDVITERNTFKLHLNNTNAFAVTVQCIISIKEL